MVQQKKLLYSSLTNYSQNGFRYFTVVDDPSNARHKTQRQAVIYPTPSYYPYGYYRRHPAFWPDPFYDMPQVVNLDPIQVSYTIECFSDSAAIT